MIIDESMTNLVASQIFTNKTQLRGKLGIDSMVIMFSLPLGLKGVLFEIEWTGSSVSLFSVS